MTGIRLHNEDWGFETNCFVCEPRNDQGLRIPFFHDTELDVVFADFELSNVFSGAPTLVHGGVTLAVLDRHGQVRAESSATFTTLGEAQAARIGAVVDESTRGYVED
jgi:hypothetical protein